MIAPIGDIQWAGPKGPTAKDVLRRHLDKCLELNAFYIGTGDYIDAFSPSNRQRIRAAGLYDSAEDILDAKALDLTQELYEDFLKPTKGRWLGMLHGHHFTQLRSGETSDMRLCQMLETRFLGTSAYIRIMFNVMGCKGSVVLWVHHGCGGGMTAAAPLNKLERAAMGWEGADIFVMGHTCRMPATRIQRPYPRWNGNNAPDLVHRDILLVNAGGFSRGHVVGVKQGQVPMGYYPELGMMNPVPLGAPLIKIVPRFTVHRLKRANQLHPKTDPRHPVRGIRKTWEPELSVEI